MLLLRILEKSNLKKHFLLSEDKHHTKRYGTLLSLQLMMFAQSSYWRCRWK